MSNLQIRAIRVGVILLIIIGLVFIFMILNAWDINDAVEENTSIPVQELTVNDITMKLITAHTEGSGYRVEVCYTLPDQRDWLLTYPHLSPNIILSAPGLEVKPTEEGTMFWGYDQQGKVTYRCQYLFFVVGHPSEASLLTLKIDKLYARAPSHPDYCLEISEKMAQSGYTITIDCIEVKGLEGLIYVKFPVELLSMDPIFKNIFKEVKWDTHVGPWSFTFPVNPQGMMSTP